MADEVGIEIKLKANETPDQRMAELLVGPTARGSFIQYAVAGKLFGPRDGKPDQRPSFDHMQAEMERHQEAAAGGDLRRASDLLITQAHTLDALSGHFMHRALDNLGQYPDAMQRYMTLALKAQAQSRATIEALAKIHQPREQVVRHVHVYEGGQAVVAEQLHMNGPRGQNGRLVDQPHTQGAPIPALSGEHPEGHALPGTSGEGKEAVSHARGRSRKRRTVGE